MQGSGEQSQELLWILRGEDGGSVAWLRSRVYLGLQVTNHPQESRGPRPKIHHPRFQRSLIRAAAFFAFRLPTMRKYFQQAYFLTHFGLELWSILLP